MKKYFSLLIIVLLLSCETDDRQYFNIKANADTTIIIKRKVSHRTFMTVKVKGKLESECLILLHQIVMPEIKAIKGEYVLKGNVNDTLVKGDLYSDYAKLVFKHRNNKAGNLELEILF